MKGQKNALDEVIRKNSGKRFSSEQLKDKVAQELSIINGNTVEPTAITLIFGDHCKGNNPLLKKVNG